MKKFAKESFFTSIYAKNLVIKTPNMKSISFVLMLVIALSLSGCFSKADVEISGSGSQAVAWESQDSSEDVNLQDTEEIGETDELWETDEAESEVESEEDLFNEQEESSSPDAEIQTETEASASWEIQTDELESYEADLEDLFKDILGELDEESVSE